MFHVCSNLPRGATAGFATIILLVISATAAVSAEVTTALYLDRAVTLEETLPDPTDLWVLPEDLTRVNDFVLKPEGACLDELCIPVEQETDNDIVIRRDGKQWFSLTGFARKLDQAYVADHATRTYSFGPIPVTRSSFLQSGMAPDFELPDRQGNLVRLSELRGKKILLLTWASW